MNRLFWHWILSAAALWLAVAALQQGVHLTHWYDVLWLAPLIGVVNLLVGLVTTFIKIIALPINILTLGCFGFVLSLACNGLAVYYLSQHTTSFKVDTIGWGIGLVIVLALFSALLNMLLPGKARR